MVPSNFSPSTVNRCALVVSCKQAFLDWVHTTPDSDAITLDEVNKECTVYLVPETWGDPLKSVRPYFEFIFEEHLYGWHTDPRARPEDRSWKTFQRYFDVRAGSMVFDLSNRPLCRDG